MDLAEQQRLYMETIFYYFHENGKWPTYGYLERYFSDISPDLEVEDVEHSLPDSFTAGKPVIWQPNLEALLTVSAMLTLPNAKDDLADFVRVLRFCAEKYIVAGEDYLEVSSDEISRELNMSELSILRAGLLLRVEHCNVYTVFTTLKNGWICNFKRGIRRFHSVETIEQYIEKITSLEKRATVSHTSNVFAGVTSVNTLEFIDANTYSIVHGDQYNISGNSGEVKVKSPSTEIVPTRNKWSSPWTSGSFYLVVFILVIVALSAAARVLSMYLLPIVMLCGLLALAIIGALQLRQDDRLSEENFLKLMLLSFKYLPWLWGKDANANKK